MDLETGRTDRSRADLSRDFGTTILDLGWDSDSLDLVTLDRGTGGSTTSEISTDLQRITATRHSPGARVRIW